MTQRTDELNRLIRMVDADLDTARAQGKNALVVELVKEKAHYRALLARS